MPVSTLHLIANSHIDPVWLWDKYEGIDEVINTFRAACDRLDEFPTLKFSASSICFLEWTLHFAPDVFARIQRHVAAGRWDIVGGWWIEPDCNLPTESSFAASHALSQRFVAQHFPGHALQVGYCPDSFGHPASLPSILAGQGLKYYLFCRPSETEKPDLPDNLFYWEHAGARVLCYRPRYHYSQGFQLNTAVAETALADADFLAQGVAGFMFGVGDHGGGPTREEVRYWLGKQQAVSVPELRFSTSLEFFQAAEQLPNIPVYSGDLHYHAVGCYSVNRNIKHAVRSAERALGYAERVNRIAGRAVDLDPSWKSTIFNQFHDILPGSCAPEAAAQSLHEMGGVLNSADWEAYEGLKRIADQTPVACPQGEFRIVNSLDHDVTGPLEIESWLYYRDGAPLVDNTGREVPIQSITPSVNCANRRVLLLDTIRAKSEKAYSFKSEALVPGPAGPVPTFAQATRIALEDRAVEAGARSVDVQLNQHVRASMSLGIVPDRSDTWSHGVRGFGVAEGWFETVGSACCEGPLASTLVVRQAWSRSRAEFVYRIYAGLPYVDLTLTIHWMETRKLLKLDLNPGALLEHVVAQGAGGSWPKRAMDAEEPLHGWLSAGSLALLQDGAFAFDWNHDRLRLTLVRANLYALHDPDPVDELGPLRPTDLGEHRFRLRLMPAAPAGPLDYAFAEFMEPFRVLRQNA